MRERSVRFLKSIVPQSARRVLRSLLKKRPRGKPFPFSVAGPLAKSTLNCCIAFNKYGAYCVPVSGLHRPAAIFLLRGDVWEAPTIQLMLSACANGDVVHAGTFFGDFLPALSAGVGPSAKIWAFEPHPESYRCARITVLLNDLQNVVLGNAGLADFPDSRPIVTADHRGVSLGGASQIMPATGDGWEPRGTQVALAHLVTLDDTIPEDRTVSIIQLDVEGYEQRVLSGAMRIIRRDRPLLIIETLPGEKWLSEHLFPLGYSVGERILENVVLRCDRGVS